MNDFPFFVCLVHLPNPPPLFPAGSLTVGLVFCRVFFHLSIDLILLPFLGEEKGEKRRRTCFGRWPFFLPPANGGARPPFSPARLPLLFLCEIADQTPCGGFPRLSRSSSFLHGLFGHGNSGQSPLLLFAGTKNVLSPKREFFPYTPRRNSHPTLSLPFINA